ncbi:MAG: hypothetical protein AB1656_16430 [Candidatus Omnitrophota bacterium]
MNAIRMILKTRSKKAIALIDEWLNDESGYDEKVWPKLREDIEINRLSERKRFDDDADDIERGN